MARVSSIPNLLRFTNSTILSRHYHHRRPSYAETSKPSSFWLSILDRSKSLTQVCQVHAYLVTSGSFDSFWARKVLKFYWDFGDLDYTILVFRYVEFPGTFIVNTVVKAYSVSLDPSRALAFYFEWLRNGFCPNGHTFVALVGSCAKIGCVNNGKKCHGQVIKNGVETVIQVQNSLVHMYGRCGDAELARKVFDEMRERDSVSWNSLVDGFARAGDMDSAREVFEEMPERNATSWNVISGGYLKSGVPGSVLELFRKMAESGFHGNDTTMVNLVTACGRSGRLREGRSVHGFLIKTALKSSVFIDSALIDMYCKCQRVQSASRVFGSMTEKNLVSWNSMILGHCIHGDPKDGIKLYDKMAVVPDEVTFIGLLCACARARLVSDGKDYFRQMVDEFNIKPNFAHYWCLANVFASAGLDELAEETVQEIPDEIVNRSSESFFWADLLSTCRFQGDVTFGEKIAKFLIEREPRKLAYYRLLLNVYAAAGRWEDVDAVKTLVKERAIGTMPRCNLVDLKEIVHNLRSGESWREQNLELGIDDLTRKLSPSRTGKE